MLEWIKYKQFLIINDSAVGLGRGSNRRRSQEPHKGCSGGFWRIRSELSQYLSFHPSWTKHLNLKTPLSHLHVIKSQSLVVDHTVKLSLGKLSVILLLFTEVDWWIAGWFHILVFYKCQCCCTVSSCHSAGLSLLAIPTRFWLVCTETGTPVTYRRSFFRHLVPLPLFPYAQTKRLWKVGIEMKSNSSCVRLQTGEGT